MKIFSNFDLTYFNTFQLKSIAKTVYFPETEEELKEIFCKINAPVLASGSNVLLRPEISELICLQKLPHKITEKINCFYTDANTHLGSFIQKTMRNGYTGFESLFGIPGTIGGAIYGNAGSGGCTISDYLCYVWTIDKKGQDHCYFKNKCNFKRRNSIFQDQNEIITKACFRLPKGKPNTEVLNKTLKWRRSFPASPNAGGIFKNWYVLKPYEKILKTLDWDNVKVWDKHINIILNKGNASYDDVINLIWRITEIVKEPLELEVKIL